MTEQLTFPMAIPGDRAYIAGPMSDIPYNNFDEFDGCAAYLRPLGVAVFNPAEEDRKNGWVPKPDGDITGFDRAAALKTDFLAIIRWATCIVLLPGWEKSSGAKAERIVAEETGKFVLLYNPKAPVGERLTPAPPWKWGSVEEVPDWYPRRPTDADQNPPRLSHPTGTFGEVRTVSATGGAKGVKPARFDLVPAGPLDELARLYGYGVQKYAPRNWENGYEWSKSFAAMMRHAWAWWGGEDRDPEHGLSHLSSVAWHAFALMEWADTHPEHDDRPNRLDLPVGNGQFGDKGQG